MFNYAIFLLILNIICSTEGNYDTIPKIITKDGNLIFESGINKNISFRLRGKSWLNVDNVDILSFIKNNGRLPRGPDEQRLINGGDQAELVAEINDLRNRIRGPFSLDSRLRILENSTAGRISGPNLRQALRRLSDLEIRVTELYDKMGKDNCASNPCQNGGTCLNLYNGFMCECPKEFQGKTCSADVNECALFAGTELGCQNNAQCVNVHGGYSCICNSGWKGIHCTRKNMDCMSSTSIDLCGHGTCVNTNDAIGYRCICEQGWKSNGLMPSCTVDVDECADFKTKCFSSCINLMGSFTCAPCPAGFTGNGYVCTDLDECKIDNGGCSQSPSVTCLNTHGSYHCGECPLGWTGDGKICTRSEEGACSSNICHPLARCYEISNTVVCSCPSHMTGNGVGPNGCTPRSGSPCDSSPCLNGGTCVARNWRSNYTCHCPRGFSLPNCQRPSTACSSNPCLNGGTCLARGSSYTCRCPPGYIGNVCGRRQNSCGGIRTELTGSIKYPPSSEYEHNVRCVWLMRTNITKVLNVTFQTFDLPESRECRPDWLRIHDGPNTAYTLIGRYCGNQLPKGGNLISTRNQLYLWFQSANSTSRSRFELSWQSIDPICGGRFEINSYGTISSPGSPGHYPPDRDCKWQLVSPSGTRIELSFFSLQLEKHNSCNYDFLAVYEGTSIEDPLLEKFCNSSQPQPLTVPSNEVLIHFHSDNEGSDTGFQIHYKIVQGYPGCGGTFTDKRGELSSPTFTTMQTNIILCEYNIQLPKDNRIKLVFDTLDLEESADCNMDYIEIFDGPLENSSSVGKWCGKRKPSPYTSISNFVRIKLVTMYIPSNKGFQATYEIVCGGKFEDEGIITSPMYPKNYSDDRLCTYEIIAPLDKAIVLEFQDLQIEVDHYGTCNYDYIEIFEGAEEVSRGKYCGNNMPPKIVTEQNYINIKFHADVSNSGRGFKANFTFIEKGCGGVLKDPSKPLKPPMSADTSTYLHNQRCTWTIVAPEGHAIQLIWKNFQLEGTSDCYYDFVEIYDNGTSTVNSKVKNNVKIGKYCGEVVPSNILSSGNIVTIVYETDETENGAGFVLEFSFLDLSRVCRQHFYSPTGVLQSPDYPNTYPRRINCTYIVTVPAGNLIELHVNHFDVELTSGCFADFIEIRNGASETSPLIGKYCGNNIPDRIPSFSNQLYMRFETDESQEYSGFEIAWDGMSNGCGTVLQGDKGTIYSPNYPNPYMHNAQCEWRIVVSKGSVIDLVITDLQLEQHYSCFYDYLEIYDGSASVAYKMGTYCHSEVPIYLRTTSNIATVRLVTDYSNSERGFQLNYTTNCNIEIKSLHGVIESPMFPYPYSPNINCEWKIRAPKGNKIALEFSHLELEYYGTDCSYDFVEIIQGTNVSGQTYCRNIPPPMKIDGNAATIKFITDESIPSTGFRLEYEVVGCVGTLTDSRGEITSPQYPNHYPPFIECKWLIQAPVGNSIELTIIDMDITHSDNCSEASLLITSARNHSDIIGRYCSKSTENITLLSHNHEMVVNFNSQTNMYAKGFRATYRTIDAKCGGRIKSNSGFIYSPNYPKNYDSNLECEWIIEAPEDRTLNLTFIEFDLEPMRNCTADYFELYDGSEANNRSLLLRYCEQEKPTQTSWVSSTNIFYLVFHTDGDTEYKGFKLSYEQNCGRTIYTNSSGYIKTDFHNRNNENCTFQIIATNLANHISFFTNLHLESIPSSFSPEIFDSNLKCISFYDGIGRNVPLKTRLCSATSIPIVSNGHALTISMTPHQGFAFAGYYTVFENVCGGTLRSIAGEIASPSYPYSYPVNISCIWNIETVDGSSVELTVTEMDIHYSKDCNEDYLEVRNGSEAGELLGVFCGNEPTQTLTANKIWLKFKSDEDGVGKGFLAHYTTSLNNELFSTNGFIKSPGYPHPIQFEQPHTWRITTDRNTIIVANITELSSDSFAFSKFNDGYDNTAPELQYSSDHPVVMTNTNILYFTASSGPFVIEWHAIPRGSIPTNNTDPKSCTNKFIVVPTNNSMNFSSPGYPNGYDSNLMCNWTFVPEDKNSHVVVKLKELDLEDTFGCTTDYLRVSVSKDLSKWEEAEMLCKLEQSTVKEFLGKPYLKIDFVTDASVNASGFDAVLMTACGSSLYDSSGIINGTLYNFNPLSTSSSVNCRWEVTVRRGRKIKLEFTEIDLPISFTKSCDSYVMFRNGIHDDSPILGNKKYCGNTTEEIPPTSSNKMVIEFKFFGHSNFKWILKYEELSEDCNQQITLSRSNTSAVITSPNYPHIPNPHSECIWIVIAPIGTSVSAHFIDRMELMQSNNCEKEYLEIRSGATSLSKVLGKYCGMTPNSVRSTENTMRLKYFTDIPEPKGGFKLNVSIENCGGTYHEPNGIISSENYPMLGGYTGNSICDYRIIRPMGTMININFLDINLPSSEDRNCNSTDHIELFLLIDEGDNEIEKQVLRSLCGEYTIPSVVMENNNVLIRFKTSQRTLLYRGFKLSYNSTGTRCVHEFESESGIITTPGYPKGSSRNKRCIWKIRVPKGRRVKVDILDYDLVPNESRPGFTNFKKLGFYNDLKFMTYISNVSDPPSGSVYSSDNIMMIYTVLFGSNERRGLKVSYSSNEPTVCKGCLDNSCGPISEPSGNLSSYYCEYPIDLQDEETLTLNVTDLLLATNVSTYICYRLSPIKVFTIDGIEVLRLCENITQFIAGIGIPSSKLVVLKNRSNGLRSFNISFIRHKCGGSRKFNGNLEIRVPSNVTSSNSPLSCAWQIQPGEGELEHFSLTGFTKFKLDCEKEFIVLYNGPLPNSPHLARYCGENTIPNITLTRGVYVEYRTTNFTNESTFQIDIKNPEQCGGRILHPFRIINFRDGYKNNVECVWDVVGAVGYKLQAVFIDRLYIEKSENCSKDVLEIRDMSEKDSVPPMRICGRDQPPKFTANSNRLQITFRSDNDIVGDGFSLNFTQVCGGVFPVYNQKHFVYSPNYPHDYDPNLNCNYTFVPENLEKVIVLRFSDVLLEQANNCKYDNITIYKHTSTESSFYTPTIPLTVCSAASLYDIRHQNAISVVFQTDNQIQEKGFIIEYGYEDCGGVITTPQIVASPRQKLDGKYAHNMDCYWNITAPQGKKIIIKIEELNFEYGSECFYDYVEIYSGHHFAVEQRLARLCGDINGTVINVEKNKAIIHSHSDHSDYSEGFKALVAFVDMCDDKIIFQPGTLTYEFKAFSGSYANNLDCQYIFKAPDNYHIQIQFENFHIATCGPNSTDECNCDYVEIRDGAGPFAELIEKACGHTPPPALLTTKSTAYVRFVSDSETTSSGFKAIVTAIETVCGTTKYNLDTHSGRVVITSPGSETYLPNIRCQWQIFSNQNDIHLDFEKFDLQDADSNHKCSSDMLVIYADKGTSTVEEGLGEDTIFSGQQQQSISTYYSPAPSGEHMFCGHGKPSDYYTNSREVFLKFVTDDQVEKSGFKIIATAVEGCYKNYTSTQGRIYLESTKNCIFSINAPENYSLTLYYSAMYFGFYTCDTEKIEVYDGKTNQLLQKLCGDAEPPRSLFTNTNKLKVNVSSTGLYNTFDITYLASNTGAGCGGDLFNYQGLFTSPFYPLNTRNYSDCRWNIRVPQNLKVILQFQEFDLGSSTTCRSDYLQIIEVEDNHTRDEEVRRYCGGDTPKYYRGKRSYLSVRFHKTVNYDGTGWIIRFQGIHENTKILL